MTVQIRWDASTIATCDAVLAMGLPPSERRREIARRLGVERVDDEQMRKGYRRAGRPLTFRAEAPREDGPPTQRSVRVPTPVPPAEVPCRDFVAPANFKPAPRPLPNEGVERLLLIPDCHHPFVDRRAWNCMLMAADYFKPDTIAEMGDFIDCYSVSAHDKNPARRERLVDEVEAANAALDELDALGATRKIALEGNHSVRLAKMIASRAPGLHGMLSLRELLRYDQRGWEFYDYRRTAKIGTLSLVHDVGEAGRYAAMRARDAYEGDVVIGHVHQMSVSYSGSAKADMHVGACLGWLGAPVAAEDYMAEQKVRRHWQTGFGIGYRDRATDRVVVVPVPIFGGRCIVEGRLFVAAA